MCHKEETRLLELDFHTRKKIILKDVSPDSIKHVQGKNVKPETMLYNFTMIINWNDISNIDYTTEAGSNHKLKSLSEKLCDNVIFFTFRRTRYIVRYKIYNMFFQVLEVRLDLKLQIGYTIQISSKGTVLTITWKQICND